MHHQASRFLESYVEKLREVLDEEEVLMFEINATEIRLHGEKVTGDTKAGEELAYGLHMEGARGLSISKDARTTELHRLADILVREWSARDGYEDDLVAASWRAEFESVHFDIADHFSAEDELGIAADREDLVAGHSSGANPDAAQGDSLLIPEIQGLLAELEAQAGGAEKIIQMKQDEVAFYLKLKDELHLDSDLEDAEEHSLLQVDEQGQRSLREEVRLVSEGLDTEFELVGRVLYEAVLSEDDLVKIEAVGAELARHVTELIVSKEVESAGVIVRRLLALADGELAADSDKLTALQKGYATMIGEDSLSRLGQVLSQSVVTRREAGSVFTLLLLLPKNVLVDLVSLGALSSNPSVRQTISDVVLLRLQGDVESLMTLLVTASSQEAVVPLLAIGRLDAPQSIERCIELATAPEKETREAALRALRRQQSPRIQGTMLKSLEDSDSAVRMEALRYLSVYRDRQMLPNIEVRMRSKLLQNCSEEERRSWFLAYGIIGRLEAIPMLRGVLTGQQEVAGPERSVTDSAIRALVVIGTDESRAALEFAVRKRPDIKDIVQQVTQERRGRV